MKVHQYCYFALKSETMSAADITARLGMDPDEVVVLGSKSAERRVPRSHSWKIVHRGTKRVDDQIEHVISRLAPVRPGIRTLVDEGASAVLQVVRYFHHRDGGEEFGWHLSPAVLAFLAEVTAALDVDEYDLSE
jgi:ketosteroid isomerase-like protein